MALWGQEWLYTAEWNVLSGKEKNRAAARVRVIMFRQ